MLHTNAALDGVRFEVHSSMQRADPVYGAKGYGQSHRNHTSHPSVEVLSMWKKVFSAVLYYGFVDSKETIGGTAWPRIVLPLEDLDKT